MTITPILYKINEVILNPLIMLMFAVALLVFMYGVFQFVWRMDSDDARDTGKRNMLYGIIGLFIMVGVYGIIRLVLGTFGITPPAGVGL